MKWAIGPLLVLALAGSAVPALARAVDPSELERAAGDFAQIRTLADAERVSAKLESLRKRGGATETIARIDIMRGVVLSLRERFAEADAAFAAADKALPGDSRALTAQFEMSTSVGNLGGSTKAIDRLVDAFPDVARKLDAEKIYPVIRAVREKDESAADTLTVRLASIGWGEDRVSYRDSMALSAAEIELKRGNVEAATGLARRLVDRGILVDLLTKRTYEQLWPSVEARVGDRMEQPAREAIAASERWLAENPSSVEARHELLVAYRNAGRLTDAERVGAAFALAEDASIEAVEAAGWLVNDHATVLLRLGRTAESDTRFAALRKFPIERAPWLINMVINRAEYLTRTKRDEAAWPLIVEAETLSKSYGSPYARQLVRRMKACVAFRQHRPDAAALAQAMMDHSDDARGATVEGLMCLDRADEAAGRAVAVLGDKEKRDGMVDSLLPDSLTRADPSSWGASVLLERPDVRAAFDKVARLLPERFAIPPGGLAP